MEITKKLKTSDPKDIVSMAKSSRGAALSLQSASNENKNKALDLIHQVLKERKDEILKENKKDLEVAKQLVEQGNLSSSLIKRLDLQSSADKYQSLLDGCLDVKRLENPVGKCTLATKLDEGLELRRFTCPVGVLVIIFEARPEVVVQISCLAIKSGNAVILKGGKEASHSNQSIYLAIQDALAKLPAQAKIPPNAVQLVSTREEISSLLSLDRYVDLVIPRGSKQLVQYIQNNTRIPVLGHADGLCSIYVDETASLEKAIPVLVDAKTSYPAACNTVETLLVHKSNTKTLWPSIAKALLENKVTLKCDPSTFEALESLQSSYTTKIMKAMEQDFDIEFLDYILAVKQVESLEEAMIHINEHGSHHTDAIITEKKENAERFMQTIDAAGVYWNASTRFADGFRYGFGAEIGVSTNKTHARGPVGLEGLVIYKYKLIGNGHYSTMYGEGKKNYLHEDLL